MTSLKQIPTPMLRRLRLRCLEMAGDPDVGAVGRAVHRELKRRAKGGRVQVARRRRGATVGKAAVERETDCVAQAVSLAEVNRASL
jgi:hypothetical protein